MAIILLAIWGVLGLRSFGKFVRYLIRRGNAPDHIDPLGIGFGVLLAALLLIPLGPLPDIGTEIAAYVKRQIDEERR